MVKYRLAGMEGRAFSIEINVVGEKAARLL
jgi:hypothetical protein